MPFKKSIIITDKTKKRPITLQTFSFIDPFMFFYIRHRYINSKRLREAKDKLYIVVLISLSVDLLVCIAINHTKMYREWAILNYSPKLFNNVFLLVDLTNLGTIIEFMIGWFIKLSVQTFQPLI